MLANLEPEAHLLDFESLGIALAFLKLLRTLIVVLAPVDDLGNRRIGVRRYFNQVKVPLLGKCQSFITRENTELLPIFIYDA
jgi:hypothetical protein